MKKIAFTLSELLIVLAIIGVVAVLTVPNVTLNTSTKINDVTLKSTYSQVADAIKKAMIDQGVRNVDDLEFVGATATDKLSRFTAAYFDVSKVCGSKHGDCFADSYKNISGRSISNPFTNNGVPCNLFIKLANGASVAFALNIGSASDDSFVLIDANGSKAPNTFGKDTFADYINPNGELGIVTASNYLTTLKTDCGGYSDASVAIACLGLLKAKNWELESYLD